MVLPRSPVQLHREAMQLAAEHRIAEALGVLAEALRLAKQRAQPSEIAMIATSAGLLYDGNGQPHVAAAYYQIAAQARPDDPHVHLALGDLYDRLGTVPAEPSWQAFERLARASKDPKLAELLAAHLKKRNRS